MALLLFLLYVARQHAAAPIAMKAIPGPLVLRVLSNPSSFRYRHATAVLYIVHSFYHVAHAVRGRVPWGSCAVRYRGGSGGM